MRNTPLGLISGDFDAYHPDRAASNAYSRPRLEFKQRAMSWARGVTERLRMIGIPVDVHASDEHPSVRNGHRVDQQWVFFWRDAAERAALDALLDQRRGIVESLHDPSPYYRHAFLALRLDSNEIEVSAQLHADAWVDFESFRGRLARDDGAEVLLAALSRLPEQFSIGISGRDLNPVAGASADDLTSLVSRVVEQGAAFWVGWTVPRDVALEHTTLLDEQLEDALIALAPVYMLLAWNEADDPAGIGAKLSEMREAISRAAAERAAQDRLARSEREREREHATAQSRERTRERVDYDALRPRPTLANLFKPDSPASASEPLPRPIPRKPAQRSSEAPKPSAPLPPAADWSTPAQPKRPRDAEVNLVPGGTFEKGAQVRVQSGPFAGKVGVISELDGRGGARVMLGLLSTRLLLEDLTTVVQAKDRPPLQSSHRRPIGRSGK